MATVPHRQRFRKDHPCPICGGHDDAPRGQGERCYGFLSANGLVAHCTRDEYAGQLRKNLKSDTYDHRLRGDCGCSVRHDPSPPRERQHARRRQVAIYDYADAQGTLLYQVVRYVNADGTKTFKQRRPDGKGGWIWNLKGVRRVPYRLRELLGAVQGDAGVILVVEGEKDVDRLRALGYPATCNPGGARKWRPDFADYFRGALLVVVLADNDPEGRQHAQQVCKSLLHTVRTVKRHDFTDLPKGGDVSDWLDAGHTAEDLDTLLRQAAIVTVADVAAEEADADEARPSAARRSDADDQDDTAGELPLSDFTNAEALVRWYGEDLHYCYPWKSWLVWDSQRWLPDDSGQVMRWAKHTIKRLAAHIADIEDTDQAKAWLQHIKSSLATHRLKAMVESAQSELGIPVLPSRLDADPWRLNCLNGTLDLRTGQLQAHRREDLLTKRIGVNYDAEARCPRWEAFLYRIMGGPKPDEDGHEQALLERHERAMRLIGFLQRAIGYSLTGDTSEQCLFLLHGPGANGKSTFLELILALLGDYAKQAEFSTFLDRQHDPGVRNDVAELRAARFVSAIEAAEGKRLAEVLIKQLTGGDTIKARFLYQEFFQFQPQFKLFLAANHKPVIRGTDYAIWRRIRLVPFSVTIPKEEQDKQLAAKLREELPGILSWAVRGCLAWQKDGLGEPEEVQEATAAYRAEMDVLADFLQECCLVAPYARVAATALFTAYVKWSEANSETPLKRIPFVGRLEERGFTRKRSETNGAFAWHGLGLRKSTEPTE